jgi:N-acetylmuramoyl-L-alanine amidase
MSYTIIKSLIPGLPQIPFRHGIGAYEGVVAHATAVYEDSDTGERNFEARDEHWKRAYVHFFVDYDSITQVSSTDYEAYGAGSVANKRFVHVELCQTRDANKFKESYARYIWLIAKLLRDKRLGVIYEDSLWGHDDVRKVLGDTTHTDPYGYLASHGVTKDQFIQDVKKAYDPPKKEEVKVSDGPFKDVSAERWSAKAIERLKKNDILNGYKDGTFGPANPVTREEFAAGICKLLDYLGK